MHIDRPYIITFIGDMTILGALLIIATLFPSFVERFGIDFGDSTLYSLSTVRAIIAVVLLIAAVGFLKLKRWGYWLMVTSNVVFSALPIILSLLRGQPLFYQGIIQGIIGLVFLIPTGKYFIEKKLSS